MNTLGGQLLEYMANLAYKKKMDRTYKSKKYTKKEILLIRVPMTMIN